MNQIQGFSPNIQRYLTSLKGEKRQNLINQISNLNPSDLENLEMQLQQKYNVDMPVQEQPEQQSQMDESMFMELNGLQPQYKMGGKMKSKYRYADGGEMGDDSAEFLEQQYQNRLSPQDLQALNGNMMVNMPSNVLTPEQSVGLFGKTNNFRQGSSDFMSTDANRTMTQQQMIEAGINSNVQSTKTHIELGMHSGLEKKLDTQITNVEKQRVKQHEKESEKIENIKKIQRALREKGATDNDGKQIVDDGIFGKKTEQAIMKLQASAMGAKEVDGIVGAKTKLVLELTDKISGTYRSVNSQAKKDLGIPVSKPQVIVPDPVPNKFDPTFGGKVTMINGSMVTPKTYTKNTVENIKEGVVDFIKTGKVGERYYLSQDKETQDKIEDNVKIVASFIPLAGIEQLGELAASKALPILAKSLPKITQPAKELLTKYGDEVVDFTKKLSGKSLEKVKKYGSQFYEKVADTMTKTGEGFKTASNKVLKEIDDKLFKSKNKVSKEKFNEIWHRIDSQNVNRSLVDSQNLNRSLVPYQSKLPVSSQNPNFVEILPNNVNFVQVADKAKKTINSGQKALPNAKKYLELPSGENQYLNETLDNISDPFKRSQYAAELERTAKKALEKAKEVSQKAIDAAKKQKELARRRRVKGEYGGMFNNNKFQ